MMSERTSSRHTLWNSTVVRKASLVVESAARGVGMGVAKLVLCHLGHDRRLDHRKQSIELIVQISYVLLGVTWDHLSNRQTKRINGAHVRGPQCAPRRERVR